jgi:hypothetical protein
MEVSKMKRIIVTILLLGALWFMLVGMECEVRSVEVPVLGTAEAPIQIDTADGSFVETNFVDLTAHINEIVEAEGFDEVIAIILESITYKIIDNESQSNTMVNGQVQVRATTALPYKDLVQMTNVNLTTIEDVEQSPPLDADGVLEINRVISPVALGTNQIYFTASGTATPAPGPTVPNVRFKLVLKVAITIIGVIEAEVPVM